MIARSPGVVALVLVGCGCAGTAPGLPNDAAAPGDAARPEDAAHADAAAAPDAAAPTDAARDVGAAVFTHWHECGWSDPVCTCDGVLACEAVAGGAFEPLGSSQARVCGTDGNDCIIDVFDETEGGGVARRCRIPRSALACSSGVVAWGAGTCEPLFSCNLLMGDCPPDVMPGSSVIACR